jgi:hypothetical protein
VNIGLCLLDSRNLKRAGHDTSKFGGWCWLVPAYLYTRASKLKQSKAPFIVWLILFILSLGA